MSAFVEYLKAHGYVGKAKAKKRRDVAAELAVSIRDVRELAEAARKAGFPVCYSTDSKAGGIYLASTSDETVDLIQQIRGECVRRLRQYSALRKALRDRGQGRLFPRNPEEVFGGGA